MPTRIEDLLDLDSLLTPEDIELRQTVRRFGEQRLRPHIADWFEAGEVPARELAADLGKLGVLGMHLKGYGCGGSTATAYGLLVVAPRGFASPSCERLRFAHRLYPDAAPATRARLHGRTHRIPRATRG